MSPAAAPTISLALADCLDRESAARYLNLSPATLASWAITGKHLKVLKWFKLGKRVWYRRECLDRFVELQMAAAVGK
jgi:hypothetical protein